jgi:hypothetical protein
MSVLVRSALRDFVFQCFYFLASRLHGRKHSMVDPYVDIVAFSDQLKSAVQLHVLVQVPVFGLNPKGVFIPVILPYLYHQ